MKNVIISLNKKLIKIMILIPKFGFNNFKNSIAKEQKHISTPMIKKITKINITPANTLTK